MAKKSWGVVAFILIVATVLSACSKSTPLPTPTPTPPPAPQVDALVGAWTGTMINSATGEALTVLELTIQAGCTLNKTCGTYAIPQLPCGGDLVYTGPNGEAFRFTQHLISGDVKVCGTGSLNELTLLKDGTLSQTWTDGVNKTHATLSLK